MDNALLSKIMPQLGKRQILPPPLLAKASESVLGAAGAAT